MRLLIRFKDWLVNKVVGYLSEEAGEITMPLCDFARFRFEVRPGDVILVEGRSRLSEVIKNITLSNWTHGALYVGRFSDIENKELQERARSFYYGNTEEPLIVEALIGEGVVIAPLTKYQYHNLRICRPKDLSPHDARQVIAHSIKSLGMGYHTRQLFDIARFILPYSFLPKRWRSTLLEHSAGDVTKTICSTMLAEAFADVHYPILPMIRHERDGSLKWIHRNSSLFTPRDFDYSPYFDIIKYPFLGIDTEIYKKLPWDATGVLHNDDIEALIHGSPIEALESIEGVGESGGGGGGEKVAPPRESAGGGGDVGRHEVKRIEVERPSPGEEDKGESGKVIKIKRDQANGR